MIEQAVEIRTPDGTTEGFLYHSEDGRPRPGVLYLTDIGGIRPAQHDKARQLAEQGYVVLMPNVFFRTGKLPLFDFKPAAGEERSMKRFAELSGPLTPEAMERDGSTYVDFLASHDSVRRGPLGVVGYCFSGSMAMRVAAARPEIVAAAASFHGGRLATDAPTSPHLTLPRIKARLYFGHAVQDRSMPEEAIAKLNGALAAWGGRYESEVYDGARHSWTEPDSPVYNPAQARRAFEKLTQLFNETLA
ncbi:MAG: dienelactone hydrolase family protein [Candidatus Sulfotelmatobacter sp.]